MAENIYDGPPSTSGIAGPMQEVTISIPKGRKFATSYPPPELAKHPMQMMPSANPFDEYVAGEPNWTMGRYLRTLPQYIDDVTGDLGDDVYEKMQFDPQVYSCLEILKLSVLEGGVNFSPNIEDKEDDDFKKSEMANEFCKRNIDGLDRPFVQWCYEMLDGMAVGSRVSEKVFTFGEDDDGNATLDLRLLKVKPRKTTAYVVDAFMNVIGIAALIPGRSFMIYYGTTMAIPQGPPPPNILPREKFAIFTHNPKNNDPRGTSILRAAYDPWWSKTQIKGEFLRYLSLFATPSLWGTTPENAQGTGSTDSIGNTSGNINSRGLTPQQKLNAALVNLRNGACGAFAFGTTIQAVQIPNNEQIFITALEYYNKEITKAILAQTLATEEGEHMSRSATESHRDIFDIVMSNVRRQLIMMIQTDILRPLLAYNFGDKFAKKFCPSVAFGAEGPKEDMGVIASAVSTLLQSGFLAPSQFGHFDEQLGLPTRKDKSLAEINIAAAAKAPPSSAGQAGAPSTGESGKTPATPAIPASPKAPASFAISSSDILRAKLTVAAFAGTSEGAKEGWDKRGRKEKDVSLPKNPKKLDIDVARAFLKNKGYELGKGEAHHHEGHWQIMYEIKTPEGKIVKASVKALVELIYGKRKEAA